MLDFIPYIKGLEFPDGVKVINSGRKTGFVGFILGLQNAISMFHDLSAKTDLYFFPTYKIIQDHIETSFSESEVVWDLIIILLVGNLKLDTSEL